MTLFFVTTETRNDSEGDWEEGETNFWIVLASTSGELHEMMEDDYTRIVDFTEDINGGVIDQYGGMAMLCAP